MMRNIFKITDYKQWEPFLQSDLVKCHYEMHHMKYIENLIKDKIEEYTDVLADPYAYNQTQINNALQIHNHNIFWQSIKLNTQSFEINIDDFKLKANRMFGSGWVWLVQNKKTKQIHSIGTQNAEKPSDEYNILACLDLWEHAYYIQYFGNRATFINVFCSSLLNYDYIKDNIIKH